MNRLRSRMLCFCVVMSLACLSALAKKDDKALPEVGKAAPSFSLPATQIDKVLPDKKDATTLSLSDLKGKNVVLFFFPKAMTKGCTIESCGFRDRVKKFADVDTVIVGISNDSLDDQGKFTSKEKLSFPLLADTDKSVTKAYGALSSRNLPSRYTFVIDKSGVLRKVYTKVSPANHPDQVLEYIKGNLTK